MFYVIFFTLIFYMYFDAYKHGMTYQNKQKSNSDEL